MYVLFHLHTENVSYSQLNPVNLYLSYNKEDMVVFWIFKELNSTNFLHMSFSSDPTTDNDFFLLKKTRMYFKYFFLLGGGRGPHPLGPENPLNSIDFTIAGGDGLALIAPGPLRIRLWATVVYI